MPEYRCSYMPPVLYMYMYGQQNCVSVYIKMHTKKNFLSPKLSWRRGILFMCSCLYTYTPLLMSESLPTHTHTHTPTHPHTHTHTHTRLRPLGHLKQGSGRPPRDRGEGQPCRNPRPPADSPLPLRCHQRGDS